MVPGVCFSRVASQRSMDGSAAAQIQEAADGDGPDLLETWLILEYCDQGSFDHAIRSGKFNKNLVSAGQPACYNTSRLLSVQ